MKVLLTSASACLLNGGSKTSGEKSRTRSAGAFHRGRNAFWEFDRSACVCLEHEPQCAALPVERGEELGAAVGRRENSLHQSFDGRIFRLDGLAHARFEIPAGTMVVAQSGAFGAGLVLDTRSAERYVAQQVRTRNKGHRVFL
jgi:hypothetical protein